METKALDRREALRIALATSALLLVSGCGSFRKSESSLDKAYHNLHETLEAIATDDIRQDRLVSIARQIEKSCQELTREHDEFRQQFDALSRKRDTTSSELTELTEDFAARRTVERDELLRIQDELRTELT